MLTLRPRSRPLLTDFPSLSPVSQDFAEGGRGVWCVGADREHRRLSGGRWQGKIQIVAQESILFYPSFSCPFMFHVALIQNFQSADRLFYELPARS